MNASKKDILVVIPCLNEEAMIAAVLDQLLADEAAERSLIVVADGGSKDLSRAIVRRYEDKHPGQVALMDNPGRYQSAGVNIAMRRFGADFDWLVRVDAHCVYPANYVSQLVAAAKERNADSVVVPMRTVGRTCLQRGIAAAQNSRFGTGGSAHRHPGHSLWVEHGHHALFRTEKYAAVGGYDETYTHNEDAELDHRLTKTGAKIWLQGDLAITYVPRQELGSLFRQYFAYGRGRARTVMRHNARLRPRQMAPLLVPPAVLLALAGPWWPEAAVPAAIWMSCCLLIGLYLGLKHRSLCALSSAAAFMVMHLAWGNGFLFQAFGGGREPASPAPTTFVSSGTAGPAIN
jgi:succinoglycan biosynthesis protein ExoA